MLEPLDILNKYFGHKRFRNQQLDVIERSLRGEDSLVLMPTGMGKSVCFQIPALMLAKAQPALTDVQPEPALERKSANSQQTPLTLVLSPLIALMKDQVDGLLQKGISATYVNSTLTAEERQRRYRQIADGEFTLLYVTPERFRQEEFCEVLERRRIVLLVVDEAHCVSQWGHDFRPEYSRVGEIRQQLGSPPTLALTATATQEVRLDILAQLGLSETQMAIFQAGIERPNLALDVVEVWGDDQKLEQIIKTRQDISGSGIVYFNLIRHLMEFSDVLNARRIDHLIYHGELPRHQRRHLQDRFMQQPKQLVLATNAFGMGIDKEDIRFVVHADLPGSLESYYQEIGRAGRDGKPAQCVLLYDERDLATQMEFLEWSNPNAEYYFRVHQILECDLEKVNSLGIEWLHEKLHFKQKHDRRLETALAMFHRWGVIKGADGRSGFSRTGDAGLQIERVNPLPIPLTDQATIDRKKKRDQMKLLAMMQYARQSGDRHAFIRDYFS
jgi:ATP-dependent DNA helicase RecQ